MDWLERWKCFLKEEEHEWETKELKLFRENLCKTKPEIWSYYVYPRYNKLVDFFGGILSEDLQHRFIQDWEKDYVLETLRSHDSNELYKALKRNPEFKDLISGYNYLDNTGEYQTGTGTGKDFLHIDVVGTKENPRDKTITYLKNSQELKKLLDFFGYTLTDTDAWGLQLEPNFPETATEYIYKICKGKVYHLTDPETAELIQKNGLKCRVGKRDPETGTYIKPREYPARIYVYALEPKKSSELKQELRKLAEEVCEPGEVVVFQADVYNSNIDFYKDTAMGDGKFFTYTDIPANLLKVYDRFTLES